MKTVHQGGNLGAVFQNSFRGSGSDHRSHRPPFRVTVVHTTSQATIAALRTAADLATGLGAEVVLLSTEEIPPQLPLDQLPVPVDLLERRLHRLVYASGIRGNEVIVQLLLCRNKFTFLRHALRPGSLVVIAESKHCWSRRNATLQHFLRYLGHQVVIVANPQTKCFRRDWDWEALVIRALLNFGSRRIEV